MNSSIIRYILGCILKTEAALMLLPCLIAIIYQEKEANLLKYFATGIIVLILSIILNSNFGDTSDLKEELLQEG